MISSFFSFFWGLAFRHILSILCSIFSVLIIMMLAGVTDIDQIISFLNIEEPTSSQIKEFYKKIVDASKNSLRIVLDIFFSSKADIENP